MTPERKHGGCHDCRSLDQEILTSRPGYTGQGVMSFAVCDGCAAQRDEQKAAAQRLNERLAAS